MIVPRVKKLASIALLVVMASCLPGESRSFRLNAVLDGQKFDGGGVLAAVDSGMLSISASALQQLMSLRVRVPSAPGTVNFATDSLASSSAEIYGPTATWSTIFGGSGSVTFTKISADETSGTFSFTARITPTQTGAATKVVTNGSFLVRF